MTRLTRIHLAASVLATLTLMALFCGTVLVETLGSSEQVRAFKRAVPWAFSWLIPSLVVTGVTGFRVAGGRAPSAIAVKLRRMKLIAGNGALLLTPLAFFLAHKAARAELDTAFYIAQGVELSAGALNLSLMLLNMRDGFRLRSKSANKRLRQTHGAVLLCPLLAACTGTLPPPTVADAQRAREHGLETDLATLAEGQTLAEANCAICHAAPRPTDHASGAWSAIVTEMADMPFVSLSPGEQEKVRLYYRAMSRTE